MARRLSFPPLGFLRASAFASLTTSGRASKWLLRPSTFSPVAIRLRLRAAASLATRVVFSNSAMAPRTWRTRTAVGVSSMKCVGALALSVCLARRLNPDRLPQAVAPEPRFHGVQKQTVNLGILVERIPLESLQRGG